MRANLKGMGLAFGLGFFFLLNVPVFAADEVKEKAKEAVVYPVAILGFDERGIAARDLGPKVADLLFAKLVARPELFLVDRAELKKILDEQSLSASGAVKADDAVKVGQLTGARILVTGSIIHADKKLFLVAKVIGTETSRVLGATVEGNASDELAPLVVKLSDAIAELVEKKSEVLVPKPLPTADRIESLKKILGKSVRPTLLIKVSERHIGTPTIDPAAQTEISRIAKEVGFELIDAEEGIRGNADVLLTGEGFSEVAGRVGSFVTVRARVEMKAVDRKSGKVLAIDRQTSMTIDLSEQIAGKSALQMAADTLAERMLPKLVSEPKK